MSHSTIINKKKICVNCGNLDFWFSKKMCKQCATIHSTAKRVAKHEGREEDESLTNLIDDLDAIFSKYIRLKYADSNGFVSCFTSGVKLKWTEAQCGHFISRKNLATRWLPENCRPQSEHDNCYLDGNIKVFRANLEKEQSGITQWLLEQSNQVYKPSREDLKELISEYRYKLKLVETKLN